MIKELFEVFLINNLSYHCIIAYKIKHLSLKFIPSIIIAFIYIHANQINY